MLAILLAAAMAAVDWNSALVVGSTPGGKLRFAVGEPIEFSLELKDVKGEIPSGKYFLDWERRGDDGKSEKGRAALPLAEPLKIVTSMDCPGFICVEANVVDGKGVKVPKNHPWEKRVFFMGGAAVEPERLVGAAEPEDLDEYWQGLLAKLAKVPIKAKRVPVKCEDAGIKVFAVEVASAGPRPVTGYMTMPSDASPEKRYPVVAAIRGASWSAQAVPKTGPKDAIRMEINGNGFDLGRDEKYYRDFFAAIKTNGRDYGLDPVLNRDRDTTYLNGMALRAMRFLQYLKTLPEWNGEKLDIKCGSQGAFQSLLAAARVPGVTSITIYAPWGLDWGGSVKYGRMLSTFRPEYTPALNYYDPCHAARRISCPVTISQAGLGDYISPPSSIAVLYNSLRCPKSVVWKQGWTHGWTPGGMASETVSDLNPNSVVKSTSMSVVLDHSRRGRVAGLYGADGSLLSSPKDTDQLFSLSLTAVDDFNRKLTVSPDGAKKFTVRPVEGGVRFIYEGYAEGVNKVICQVLARKGDDAVRWRIAVDVAKGWALVDTSFPRMILTGAIGGKSEDDAIVTGDCKSGIFKNPMAKPKSAWPMIIWQPGSMAAQFGFYYDGDRGFYSGFEDAKGDAIRLMYTNWKDSGLFCGWQRLGFGEGKVSQNYDIVTAVISSPEGNLSWCDAADRYRKWALKQHWCRKRIRERDDLPGWMRSAPVIVRFWNKWMASPGKVVGWTRNFFRKNYPDAPLLAAYWGWEHYSDFVTDYYPCKPSNEAFAELVREMRKLSAHSFPWPSGYHVTLTCGKRSDGTFDYDFQEEFKRRYSDMSCINRDGTPYRVTPFWLRGGDTGCLCGGYDKVRRWWNHDVCEPLSRFGCEMIQVDQVTGGNYAACWSRSHGHAPNDGAWKSRRFREQLLTMREMMRSHNPDAVVCFEEPGQLFNDIIGLQDYRDLESRADEWCGVYTYLYHDFVPPFQSNLLRGDRMQQAYAAAEGQMPFIHPDFREEGGGDCDEAYSAFMRRWISLYRGEGAEYLAYGRRVKPPRLECARRRYTHHFVKGEHDLPAVFHAAFEAADGSRRVSLANGTAEKQKVRLVGARGRAAEYDLSPSELRLVEFP